MDFRSLFELQLLTFKSIDLVASRAPVDCVKPCQEANYTMKYTVYPLIIVHCKASSKHSLSPHSRLIVCVPQDTNI